MTLYSSRRTITSDLTTEWARRVGGPSILVTFPIPLSLVSQLDFFVPLPVWWELSWMPGRPLTYAMAHSAMELTELLVGDLAEIDMHPSGRALALAEELGLSLPSVQATLIARTLEKHGPQEGRPRPGPRRLHDFHKFRDTRENSGGDRGGHDPAAIFRGDDLSTEERGSYLMRWMARSTDDTLGGDDTNTTKEIPAHQPDPGTDDQDDDSAKDVNIPHIVVGNDSTSAVQVGVEGIRTARVDETAGRTASGPATSDPPAPPDPPASAAPEDRYVASVAAFTPDPRPPRSRLPRRRWWGAFLDGVADAFVLIPAAPHTSEEPASDRIERRLREAVALMESSPPSGHQHTQGTDP
ncbi:hypothetical protein [Nocardia sp. XZ_19_369]|uniref:hypothetical protein n=1 Tax=Nocardia sp. XZ_19_369 TaxID=2769487 RepID=UPI00188F5546|nr:hypothetical protein [Nocardia sp. XZ_19_369]